MKRICVLVAAALAVPVAALAQDGVAATAEAKRAAEVEQARAAGRRGGGGVRVVAGAVETKITTGRPYSAESISETLHVLADGNRISRRTVTKVYRDGEGRTRRETIAEDGSVKSIAISDPVAPANYTLDPEAKIAYKAGGNIVYPLGTPPSGGTYTYSISGSTATAAVRVGEELHAAAAARGRGGQGGAVMTRTPAPENPNVRKEDLGPQDVEGVIASGSRVTTVIPAGEIGNAQAIRIVSEQWFSDELQVLVMTKHSDPRTGETTYRLRSILRAEPDQSLFTVPSDYTIQERGVRRPQ